jgi:hypothetical protein
MNNQRSINGTIILCDNVYNADGKFIISGTYSTWMTRSVPLSVPYLHLYLRFHPERVGKIPLRVWLSADNMHNPQPLLEIHRTIDVPAEGAQVMQVGVILPGITVSPHIPDPMPHGAVLEIPYRIGYDLAGEQIATTPLLIRFAQPFQFQKEAPNASRPDPDSPTGSDQP